MVAVDVKVESREVADLLYKLDKRTSAAGLRIFLRTLAWPHLQQRIAKRFTDEGDSAVGKWAALAAATGRIRASKGFPAFHPINVRTGQMKNFALDSHDIKTIGTGGASLSIPGAGMSALIRRKITIAQSGGFGKSAQSRRFTGPNRPAPARPIYGLDVLDQEIIGNQLLDWIRSGAGSSI